MQKFNIGDRVRAKATSSVMPGRIGEVSELLDIRFDCEVTFEGEEDAYAMKFDELEPAEPTTDDMITGIREMPEAALAVGGVLVDEVHALRAELARVTAERDGFKEDAQNWMIVAEYHLSGKNEARAWAKAWKAAAKTRKSNTDYMDKIRKDMMGILQSTLIDPLRDLAEGDTQS